MFAFGAAQIGRFDEAVEYLNKAENAAEGIPKVLVLGIHGHFYYTHSRDSTDRERAGEYYSDAINHLDSHPSRLGNWLRADLAAAWTLDAIETGAVELGLERANEALRSYKSVPAARSHTTEFIEKLRVLEGEFQVSLLKRLSELPPQTHESQQHAMQRRSQHPWAPGKQESPLIRSVFAIIYQHWTALWKDLRQFFNEARTSRMPSSRNSER